MNRTTRTPVRLGPAMTPASHRRRLSGGWRARRLPTRVWPWIGVLALIAVALIGAAWMATNEFIQQTPAL